MKHGLKERISITITCMMMLMGIVLIAFSYQAFYNTYVNLYNDKAQGIVRMLANEVDADAVAMYLESGQTDAAYEQMLKHFNNVKKNTSELSYLYLFVPYEDHFTYILDAYTDQDDMRNISKLGDAFSYGEIEYQYLIPDIKNKQPSKNVIFGKDEGFGKTVSAWAPVVDDNNELVAVVEADYVLKNLQDQINSYMVGIMLFLVISMIVILGGVLHVMKKNVTIPLEKLTLYVNSYDSGEPEPKPYCFKKEDEIKSLSDSFASMIARTNDSISRIKQVTAEKERIGAELSVATRIQADMLPTIFPPFPARREIDLFAMMTPAKEVGGDFYDFFLIGEEQLAVVIADVSGKGVPAALFMVIAKTLIKNHVLNGESPKEVFENVNTQLCENNEEGMFVTAWLGILDISSGSLRYVNAGHNMPLLKHCGGEFEFLEMQSDFVLAGAEGQCYTQNRMFLEAGDMLYLYTDGVPEAVNAAKELYGDERLKCALNRNKEETPEELLSDIRVDIDRYAGEEPQFDDITMVCLKYNGKSKR
ncbi:MAG: SpoIIE family protein phosphatase [Lachnospiraceae bacterium]|nr:SpoIIE family protein phosphatase [Lachnospiraceae bacterium]